MDNNIRCFWCGTFNNKTTHVRVNEDVPPRWLSGIKKVKRENCVPQCNECQDALAMLDDAVNGYFKSGAYVDMDRIESNISFLNNKGFYARKIKLNGNDDYVQSNYCLLLWLRKLLNGLWYKQNNTYFDGNIFILSHWLTIDNPSFYISNTVTPTREKLEILFDIDEKIIRYNYKLDFEKKIPFYYNFIPSSQSGVPLPLQLLRFAIYNSYAGYCLYMPEYTELNVLLANNAMGKAPYFINKWIKCCPAYPPSYIIKLVNTLKLISSEEAAKKVKIL
jgi:hypothetical protein